MLGALSSLFTSIINWIAIPIIGKAWQPVRPASVLGRTLLMKITHIERILIGFITTVLVGGVGLSVASTASATTPTLVSASVAKVVAHKPTCASGTPWLTVKTTTTASIGYSAVGSTKVNPHYVFHVVPPGTYIVKLPYQGFGTTVKLYAVVSVMDHDFGPFFYREVVRRPTMKQCVATVVAHKPTCKSGVPWLTVKTTTTASIGYSA